MCICSTTLAFALTVTAAVQADSCRQWDAKADWALVPVRSDHATSISGWGNAGPGGWQTFGTVGRKATFALVDSHPAEGQQPAMTMRHRPRGFADPGQDQASRSDEQATPLPPPPSGDWLSLSGVLTLGTFQLLRRVRYTAWSRTAAYLDLEPARIARYVPWDPAPAPLPAFRCLNLFEPENASLRVDPRRDLRQPVDKSRYFSRNTARAPPARHTSSALLKF